MSKYCNWHLLTGDIEAILKLPYSLFTAYCKTEAIVMKLEMKNLERIIARRSPESHALLVESARLMLERHIWNNALFGLTLEQQIEMVKMGGQKIINLELPALFYCYIRLLDLEQQRRRREHLQKMFAENGTLSRRPEDRSQEELLEAHVKSLHDRSASSSGRYSARNGGNPNQILLSFVQMGLGPQLATMAHLVPAKTSNYALSGTYPLKYAFRPQTPRFDYRVAESPRLRSCRLRAACLPVLEGPFYRPTVIDLPDASKQPESLSASVPSASIQSSRAPSAGGHAVPTFLTEPGAPIPSPGPDLLSTNKLTSTSSVTALNSFQTTATNSNSNYQKQTASRKSSGALSSRFRGRSASSHAGGGGGIHIHSLEERSPVSGRLLSVERPVTPRWEREMRALLSRVYTGPSHAQLDQVELRSMRPSIRLLARNYCLAVYRTGVETEFSLP